MSGGDGSGSGARTRTRTGTPTFPVKAHHAECCMMIILPSVVME